LSGGHRRHAAGRRQRQTAKQTFPIFAEFSVFFVGLEKKKKKLFLLCCKQKSEQSFFFFFLKSQKFHTRSANEKILIFVFFVFFFFSFFLFSRFTSAAALWRFRFCLRKEAVSRQPTTAQQ
jgi:hypothetical protein